MMNKILRYITPLKINVFGEFKMELPIGCKILSISQQFDFIYFWIQFAGEMTETRTFKTISTGLSFQYNEDRMKYLGTVRNGLFVSHIFEIFPPRFPILDEQKKRRERLG